MKPKTEAEREAQDHRDQRARMRVIENRRVNRRSPRL